MKNKTSMILLVGLMMVLSISLASAQVFYESNGTIYCPDVSPGDTGLVGGVTFTAYDNSGLYDIRENEALLETACTSLVTSFNPGNSGGGGLFYGSSLNPNITHWDTSSVTNMRYMFYMSTTFNQSIGSWDISSVVDMWGMFAVSEFNQDLSTWSVLHFSNEPGEFKYNSALEPHNEPRWGYAYLVGKEPTVSVSNPEGGLFSNYSLWVEGEEYYIESETELLYTTHGTYNMSIVFEKEGYGTHTFTNDLLPNEVYTLEYPNYYIEFVVPSNSTYGVNQSTAVSVDVTCTQGDCNNISFYLDPIGEGLVVTDARGDMMMFSGDLSGASYGDWIGFMSGGDEGTCWQSDRIDDLGGGGQIAFDWMNYPQNVAVGDTFNVYSDEASCLSGFGGKGYIIPGFADWVDEAFYTTSSNPQVVSIPFGETMTLTWTINSTQLGDDFEFFVLHNSSGFVDFRQSESWFVNVSEVISGCTDSLAINFDPDADFDNGMCYYMLGCTDSLAINFDPDADMDDGTCEYAEEELEPTPTPSRGGGGSSIVEESREVEVEESEAESKLEGVLGEGLGLTTSQKFIAFAAVAVGAYLLLTPNALGGKVAKAKRSGRRRKNRWF